MTDELKYVSRAVAMDNLTSIASNLGQIRAHLNDIERDTQRLQDHARELKVTQFRPEAPPLSDFNDGSPLFEYL